MDWVMGVSLVVINAIGKDGKGGMIRLLLRWALARSVLVLPHIEPHMGLHGARTSPI